MIDLTNCSSDRSLTAKLTPPMLYNESTQQKAPSKWLKWLAMQCPNIQARQGDSVAGLWAGTVTEPGCVKQSKPLPENRRACGGGTVASPQLAPTFRQASALCCTWAWSPLYICTTGRPVPRQSGHLQESSFPLWRPGLVMPRPCHTDCSFRYGEKLRKKQKS